MFAGNDFKKHKTMTLVQRHHILAYVEKPWARPGDTVPSLSYYFFFLRAFILTILRQNSVPKKKKKKKKKKNRNIVARMGFDTNIYSLYLEAEKISLL